MKKKTTLSKFVILTLSTFVSLGVEAQLGEYAFFGGGACPHNSAYLAVTTQPTNATFSLYSTTGATCAVTSNQFGNTDWETGSIVNLNQYNEFTITPNNGYVLNLEYINFGHQVNSIPCTWHLRSSIDNFSTDIFSGQTTDSWEYPDNYFSGFTNISSTITFRFYVTGIDAISTRWRQDNVTIFGTVTQSSTPQTWYADVDNDGFGDPNSSEVAVTPTLPNAKLVAGDCNDNNAVINPNATEICDGLDNNCDANIDEGLTMTTYFPDQDMDNFGELNAAGNPMCQDPGVGFSTSNNDCNDVNVAIHPGATDIPDNGVDEDCSGADATTASLFEISNGVKIYPNPVSDKLNVLSLQIGDFVEIYSLDGTLVLSSKFKDSTIDVATLAQGTYQLVLFDQNTKIANVVLVKK